MWPRTRTLALQLLFCCAMASGQKIVKKMNTGMMAEVGSSVMFEVILSQPGVASVEWNRLDQPLNDAAKYVMEIDGHVQRLTIKNLVPTDSWLYEFTLQGQTTQGYVIVVDDDVLSITHGLWSLTINTGQTLVLEVTMSQKDIARGQWYRDGLPLTNTGDMSVSVTGSRHRLVICKARTSHTGLYSYDIRGLTTSAQQTVSGSGKIMMSYLPSENTCN